MNTTYERLSLKPSAVEHDVAKSRLRYPSAEKRMTAAFENP